MRRRRHEDGDLLQDRKKRTYQCLQWTVGRAVRPLTSRAYMTARATAVSPCIDQGFASLTPRRRRSCSVLTRPMSRSLQPRGSVTRVKSAPCRLVLRS